MAAKRTIGVMHSGTDKPSHQDHIEAIIQALEAAGYDEARHTKTFKLKLGFLRRMIRLSWTSMLIPWSILIMWKC